MSLIKSRHISKVRSVEIAALNGPASQNIRLEWITESGGTHNAPNDTNEGAVKTTHVLDVPAIWGPVNTDQKEKTRLDQNNMSIDQVGFWYFSKTLDLADKKELVVIHKVKDTYFSGAGTTAAAIWTPDVAPSWTIDQWKGHWILFGDNRFKVLSNTDSALTVDLDGGALPVGSNVGSIYILVIWNPVRDGLGLPSGATSPLGDELVLQSVYCSRQELIG